MASLTKSALITGSSRGIGRGIALKLAEQKIKIAINYVKNEAAAKGRLLKFAKKVPTDLWFKPMSVSLKKSAACLPK
jgi:NAD(P)-dependent dehydrogenase (short-subunit alcohol dehydrogenase family)